jgi:hypothetical protein
MALDMPTAGPAADVPPTRVNRRRGWVRQTGRRGKMTIRLLPLLVLRRDRPRAIDRFIDYFGEGASSFRRGKHLGARQRPQRRLPRSR